MPFPAILVFFFQARFRALGTKLTLTTLSSIDPRGAVGALAPAGEALVNTYI